jgi:ribonuclease HI
MYILHFDGMFHSLRPWPQRTGLMGYGWIIHLRESVVAHGFGMFIQRKNATSCISEYLALIEGLEALRDLQIGDAFVEVRGDAKFIINQMKGAAAVKSISVLNLHLQALKLAQSFSNLSWVWVPRKENRYADMLSHRAARQTSLIHGYPKPNMDRQQSRLYTSGKLVPLMDLRVYQQYWGQSVGF